MPKSPEYRTSAGQWDGALPMVVSSGYQTFATSAKSNLGSVVMPAAMTVIAARLRILASATSANAKINVGIQGNSDSNLDAYSCRIAAGEYDTIAATQWVSKTFAKGDVVSFELEAATAVGSICGMLVLMPTSAVAT